VFSSLSSKAITEGIHNKKGRGKSGREWKKEDRETTKEGEQSRQTQRKRK